MTLVELVVAMVVVGSVMASGYGLLYQLENAQRSHKSSTDLVELAGARHRLSRWFGVPILSHGGRVYPFIAGQASDQRIEMLSASAPPIADRPVVVSLFAEQALGAATPWLSVLVRDPDDATPSLFWTLPASDMSARYLRIGDQGRVWAADYASTIEPPVGIEIVLHGPPEQPVHRLLQLPILIATDQP